MDVDKVLHVGQLIEMRDRGQARLTSARLAAVGPSTFSLAPANSLGESLGEETLAWRLGERVQLKLLTNEGVYSFESIITELHPERFSVRKPARIERLQRREFLRVPEVSAARFSYRASALDSGRDVRCATVDISAGGVRLRPEKPLPRPPKVGLHSEIVLPLDGVGPPVRARCRVVRHHEEGAEFAVEFSSIADQERARIVRHVNLRHADLQHRRRA